MPPPAAARKSRRAARRDRRGDAAIKPRLTDIAEAAGVGTATVERVLNARGNVAPATAEKVVLAARRLGYRRTLPEPYRGTLRIEVVMMRPDTPFFRRLAGAFARMAASLDPAIVLHRTFLDENDPLAVARHLADPGFRRSGLAIVAPAHPAVAASLSAIEAAGVPTVQLVSRIGPDAPFIGIDNEAAGRSAGFFMDALTRGRSGSILALCHGAAYAVHKERVRGFSSYLTQSELRDRPFTRALFGQDATLRTAEILDEALQRDPSTVGLYNAGGANDGVAAVLSRDANARRRIVWIGHELTDDSRAWLRDGLMHVVLDQAPETQARRALDTLLHRLGIIETPVATEPVPFLTFTAQNV